MKIKSKIKIMIPVTLQNILQRRLKRLTQKESNTKQGKSPIKRKKKAAKKRPGIVLKLKKKQGKV